MGGVSPCGAAAILFGVPLLGEGGAAGNGNRAACLRNDTAPALRSGASCRASARIRRITPRRRQRCLTPVFKPPVLERGTCPRDFCTRERSAHGDVDSGDYTRRVFPRTWPTVLPLF
ncbi:unnamed protein product [Boreogadus saida]